LEEVYKRWVFGKKGGMDFGWRSMEVVVRRDGKKINN